ncbi:reverse transcriptase [Gossypium australe]|uniref:Reverse transcriptase n=1 Tax=Gossypium australe TaxID=47621 RepID=A0A5B6W7C2_9ROSI|nr:reverse transcriptase [Gossypium australe]
MKILSWNVRGLGQSRTVRRLKNKLRHIQPQIVFFIETKVTSRMMDSIRRRCGFANGIDVEATGSRGYSKSHIDAVVEEEDGAKTWRFTGFYGEPVEQNRRTLWELLRGLQNGNNLPWLVVGDFNEILFSFEKQGGRIREERQIDAFRKTLDDCELADLGFSEQWYTWERGRLVSNNIREQLDRGVVNTRWWELFPNFEVCHLQHSFSDHCPLVVNTNRNGVRGNNGQKWRFRFNADWLLNPRCEEQVKKIWTEGSQDVLRRLEELGRKLHDWSKGERKLRDRRFEELNGRLRELGDCDISEAVLEEITGVKIEMNLEADKEEIYWEQRARANWLKMGDRNTAFFHKSASHRRKKNLVRGLEDEFGNLKTEEEEMSTMATKYFKDLFSFSGVDDYSSLLESFQPSITAKFNREVKEEFTADEIVSAKYWHIVGKEITKLCLEMLNGEREIKDVNFTSIVLIPKINSPKLMSQFRPISLCNVIYKIISKVLKFCIEDTQGAFISGRQITDNIFVAYEILHSFKRRRGTLNKRFALKLDMSKAYDRVEWTFLENMMRRMRFCNEWVSVVMNCVKSVMYSVHLNGRDGEEFHPQRGFSRLISKAKVDGRLKGTKVGRGNVAVSHLFFTDDCMLFGDASIEGASTMKAIIKEYELVSGQLVNFDKSLIYFSKNVGSDIQDQVGGILGVRVSKNLEKYLGLPTMIGRRKKQAFVDIKERFLKALQNWSLQFLSAGGKEVFLKSILKAIPIYAMRCFKFPISVFRDLENIMSKFWWRNSKTNKGIHWCRWRDLCILKAQGGLGFKNFEFFNLALLEKQGWKILMQPNCLFARVMKAKYFPRGDFMSARLGSYPSFTWRSILRARHVLAEGLEPGNGRIQCHAIDIRFSKVADLIDKEANTWKQDIISSLFAEEQSRCILAIPLVSSRPSDVLIWRGDNTGCYTVKSGYKRIITTGNPRVENEDSANFFTKLWGLKIPSKIRIFLWKLVHNFLPTKANLNMRHLMVAQCVKEELRRLTIYFVTVVSQNRSCRGWMLQTQKTTENQHGKIVTKRSISAIIARNKDGLVMATCTCPWDNIPDPTTAEARACLQAIDIAE